MPTSDVEVVVIGGGAAGVAAARRLHDEGVAVVIVEARTRLGGRGWTDTGTAGFPLDLGCGWLHSADRNPWRGIAKKQGRTIDKTPPPWYRPSIDVNFAKKDQKEFGGALGEFHERMSSFPEDEPDAAASTLLPAGGAWNGLIGAVTTYLSGAEPDQVSVRDFAHYEDTGVNQRIAEGYGATIAMHAGGIPAALGAPVSHVDYRGRRLAIETAAGTLRCDFAVVTLPSNLLAAEAIRFTPSLPEKAELAAGLPLGLADKLFLGLEHPEEFDADSRLFGRTDTTATSAYHFRPFGRPLIEAYFGGTLAHELEAEGDRGFLDFAMNELTAALGSDFGRRVSPLRIHAWAADPYARGSYSSALPGKSGNRARLAEPVDGRLFFAGEACSPQHYSTAHGAYLTGIAAAGQIITARKKRKPAKA